MYLIAPLCARPTGVSKRCYPSIGEELLACYFANKIISAADEKLLLNTLHCNTDKQFIIPCLLNIITFTIMAAIHYMRTLLPIFTT